MTNEEAIALLEYIKAHSEVAATPEVAETSAELVENCIEALKWQSRFDSVLDDVLATHRYARELSFEAYSKYDEGWTDACLEIKARRSDEK